MVLENRRGPIQHVRRRSRQHRDDGSDGRGYWWPVVRELQRPRRVGALTFDASTLTLEQRDGLWRGEVDVLVAEVTKLGRGSFVRTERMELSIPNERRADVLAAGLPLTLDNLATTRYLHELRIVARDVPSGRVGSLVIPAAALRR